MGLLLHGTTSSRTLAAAPDPLSPIGQTGTRAAALGGAGVALPGSADSVLVNPAGLVYLAGPEVTTGIGLQDLGDERSTYFAGAVPLVGKLVLGLGQARRDFLQTTTPDFVSSNLALGFPLSPEGSILAGVAAKWLQRDVPGVAETAKGTGFDLGLLVRLMENEDGSALRLGFSWLDARSILKLPELEVTLPSAFRFGLTYHIDPQWLISSGWDQVQSDELFYTSYSIARIGCEGLFPLDENTKLSGRLGYFRQTDTGGVITTGVGIEWGDWKADYALQLPATGFNALHQFGVTWGYQRSGKHDQAKTALPPTSIAKTKKPTPRPTEESLGNFFSALDSAAAIEDKYDYSPIVDKRQKATAKPLPLAEEEPTETVASRAVPLPVSPADQVQTSLMTDLELPSSLSGYFTAPKGGSKDDWDSGSQPLRLHAVVNPFSPNGDGRKDTTILVGNLVDEKLPVRRWILNIFKGTQMLRMFKGGSGLPRNLEWDGRNEQGKLLSDGTYMALLRVFDKSDLELASANQQVEIRTRALPVTLEGPKRVNLTGTKDDEPVVFKFPTARGSSDWRLAITGPGSRRVFEQEGSKELPEKVSWVPSTHRTPPAGKYLTRLVFFDSAGIKTEAEVGFAVEYAKFSSSLSASPEVFKPKVKGGQGVVFSLKVDGEVTIKHWDLEIQSVESKQTVKTFQGKGVPPTSVIWDGQRSDDQPAEGGKLYRAFLSVATTFDAEATSEVSKLQCDWGEYTGEKALSINLIRVQFDPESTDLSSDARRALQTAVDSLKKATSDYQLRVTGHSDPAESKSKSLELSRNRAQAVKDLMVEQGIPADRIEVLGKGATQPLTSDPSPAALAKNRRAEVLLFAK